MKTTNFKSITIYVSLDLIFLSKDSSVRKTEEVKLKFENLPNELNQ